jgi:ribonuclease HI
LIRIYTDGSCLGNPGNGGWAFLIQMSGFQKETTNNQMELTAAISALNYINDSLDEIVIITDSNYVKNGISEWIKSWKKNNWKTANKSNVKNQHLWEKLDELNSKLSVKWEWVKAHNIDKYNNYVDELARNSAENLVESFSDSVQIF